MPKVTDAYRAARRTEILSAARRCFLRKGFQDTSLQDLIAESGLSTGAVYNYFSSKEEMIVAIAEENIDQVISVLRESAAGPYPRSLGETLAGVMNLMRSRHREDGFAAMLVLVWSEALRNPLLSEQLGALADKLRSYYGELANDVLLPEGVSPAAFAEAAGSVVPGFILQLALFGPGAAQALPDTVRAMWPNHKPEIPAGPETDPI